MALLALAHAARGEVDVAERLVDESLATSEARGLSEHPPTELAYVASGVVLLARGEVEAAEDRLEHAVTLARRGGDRIEIAQALLWLGRCRTQGGDAGGAADALAAARAQLGGARVPGLARLEAALEAEIGDAEPGPEDGAALAGDELRVLELLPSDVTYREIAERLALPADDVHGHVRRIRRKLRAVTRDEAVTAARRLELL
jgi:LuxR family maltose regulon positive regulatory protein